ncbi:hypothetical protein B296_00003180 [Ensete ventricosum]|uniref:Uncharacterized protein n=1 Tax=Ensete ventricosum TaxID=4639 RepID=A0A427B9I0_ENSVE|nr:hypothetical protein B296_00003180 [Ensete ventricosum]
MDLASAGRAAAQARLLTPPVDRSRFPRKPFGVCSRPLLPPPKLWFLSPHPERGVSLINRAKRRGSASQRPPLKRAIVEEEEEVDEERVIVAEEGLEVEFTDDLEEGMMSMPIVMEDDDDFEDELEENEFEEEEANLFVGDGGAGGGISLAGMWWDKEALAIAEEVSMSFDGDLKMYAFKTTANSTIRVRIEKISTKYGSPSIDDIEAFSKAYRSRLDEAELAERIPDNISLEVSSPGLERVVRIPDDLERFKDRPMYVKYISDGAASSSPQEGDGVFKLISYDMELCHCTWGLADVKINRQKAGKGRPLSKKQREWRLQTPFESLCLVRLHSDC